MKDEENGYRKDGAKYVYKERNEKEEDPGEGGEEAWDREINENERIIERRENLDKGRRK